MSVRSARVAALVVLVLVLTGCGKNYAALVDDIARLEKQPSADVREAIQAAASASGRDKLDLAKDWAKFTPARPVGEAVPEVTRTNFVPELTASKPLVITPISQRIDEILRQAQAEQILASSVCSLAGDTLSSGVLPTPSDIALTVGLEAFSGKVKAVDLAQTAEDVYEILDDAGSGNFADARLGLLQLKYC